MDDHLERWQVKRLERAYLNCAWPDEREISYLGLSVDEVLVRFEGIQYCQHALIRQDQNWYINRAASATHEGPMESPVEVNELTKVHETMGPAGKTDLEGADKAGARQEDAHAFPTWNDTRYVLNVHHAVGDCESSGEQNPLTSESSGESIMAQPRYARKWQVALTHSSLSVSAR